MFYRPTISQISKNVAEISQDNNVETINNNFNTTNQLFGNSKQVTSTQKDLDLKKEIKPTKIRSFFEQDSDSDDLFGEKTSNVIPVSNPEIFKQKEHSIKNLKLSRPIFSESDSDEEFTNPKSTIAKVPDSTNNNDSTKNLDSSSADDLFNTKLNNNKLVQKQESALFSSTVHKILSESDLKNNVAKTKLSIKDEKVEKILNKEIIDKFMSEVSSVGTDNTVIKTEYLPNNKALNTTESIQSKNSTIINSNKTNLDFQHSTKFDNLFSSDEDDFDDDALFNVNESHTNNIKKNQAILNPIKKEQNTNNEFKTDLKVEIFDSSDDDIFSTNKSNNNLIFTLNNKKSNSKEIKTIEPKSNDNCAIIDKKKSLENIDKIQAIGNTNVFSLSSDDDDDDDYFSFNNTSDCSMTISNKQNIDKNIKTGSLSSEELINSQIDTPNEYSVEEKEIDMTKNEMLAISRKIETKEINPISDINTKYKEVHNDSLDGSSFSSSKSNIETSKKLPGIFNSFY